MAAVVLGRRFETSPNALNLVRLALASWVIGYHSYSLLGLTALPGWAVHFSANVAVDGFFAISGYLICRSWMKRPDLGSFALARARRILPGLWVCLVVTAFLIAPLAAWLAGHPGPTLTGQLSFVVHNSDTWQSQRGVDDSGRPWNASLWSLGYEMACYAGLAVLGRARLINAFVLTGIAFTAWATSLTLLLSGHGSVSTWYTLTPRCVLMFACGALLFVWADRIVVSARVFAAAAVVLAMSAVLIPDYRLLGAPALAYLCLVGGLWLGRWPRLGLHHDLSYGVYIYAFPIQQCLLMIGAGSAGLLGYTLLSVACTLPVAALSWFLVEKPAMRLGARGGTGQQTATARQEAAARPVPGLEASQA